MRKIKFRQWDKTIKQFQYFGFDVDEDGSLFFRSPINPNRERYPVSQYSGMKDKKDVEIYEGDIVTGKKRGDPIKGDLKVIDIHWFVHDYENKLIYLGSVGDLEVIGNIYRNPELQAERWK